MSGKTIKKLASSMTKTYGIRRLLRSLQHEDETYQIVPLNPSHTSGVVSPTQLCSELKLFTSQIITSGPVQLTQDLFPTVEEFTFSAKWPYGVNVCTYSTWTCFVWSKVAMYQYLVISAWKNCLKYWSFSQKLLWLPKIQAQIWILHKIVF